MASYSPLWKECVLANYGGGDEDYEDDDSSSDSETEFELDWMRRLLVSQTKRRWGTAGSWTLIVYLLDATSKRGVRRSILGDRYIEDQYK